MAEHLGRLMLAGVEEVGFDEILSTLRHRVSKTEWHFGVPVIDSHLHATPLSECPPILEMKSPVPTSGATSMLYHFLAVAVISAHNGGQQSCVVVIDADGRFDVFRLVQQMILILHNQTENTTTTTSDSDTKTEIETALRHIHIFRPQSLASITATAASLTQYLLDGRQHGSFDRRVGLIAIDTATAFAQQTQAEDHSDPSRRSDKSGHRYVTLGQMLRRAQLALSCPIVVVWRHESRHHRPFHQEQQAFMSAWSSSDGQHLQLRLEKPSVRKFPARSSVQEAQRDAGDRQKAVDTAVFRGAIHSVISEAGNRSTPLEFDYQIDEHGLTIIQPHDTGLEPT